MNENSRTRTSDGPIGVLLLIPILFGSWLVITSLTEVVPGLGLYDGKRILELYLIFLTLSLVLFNSQARQNLDGLLKVIPGWIRVLFLLFFGLGISSALLTPHPAYPLTDVAMLFLLAATAMAVACAKQISGIRFDRLVLGFLAFMGFAVFFQELIGLLVYLFTDQQFSYREALFHFLHPRLYNQVQTWSIPLLAILPMAFDKSRWVSLVSIFLIGAQWYILLSTGARGSSISLMSAMLIIGLILPASRSFWVKIHISGLVLGILFYVSAIGFLATVQPDHDNFVSESIGRPLLHTSGRTDLWRHAINDAIENPILGAGPMRYACGADHYLAGSPHNFPLQILGEWGIPAVLILGILFVWLVYSWMRTTQSISQKSDYEKSSIACLSISCLAAIIHVNASGLLIAPSSQITGSLVAGWLLGSLFNKGHTSLATISTDNSDAKLLFIFALIISVSVLVFATTELDKLPFRTSYAQDYGPTTPRFWQDGRFCEFSF